MSLEIFLSPRQYLFQKGFQEVKPIVREEFMTRIFAKPKYTDASVAEIEDIPLSEVVALRKKVASKKESSVFVLS